MIDLKMTGKVALVSGATGGIGRELCKMLKREGCKIGFIARNQEKADALIRELDMGDDLYCYIGQIYNEEDVKAFTEGAYAHFGKLDMLFPNAGYEGKWEYVNNFTKKNFEKVFGTNVLGVMYMIKYGADYLVAQGKGSIVVTSSDGALLGSAGMGVYCASKHAVQAIVKTAAAELGPKGVNVNSVNPGGVDTTMIRNIEDNALGDSMSREEKSAAFTSAYFDKRYATAEECANMLLFLASDWASHMFGERVSIDGGECVLRP
ncbi:MAG: SDR family oxidoreductase [Lachnospiraceae bacterium]|nr:SDR family oxidoreductase [Lachnospiraceae bacterium]